MTTPSYFVALWTRDIAQPEEIHEFLAFLSTELKSKTLDLDFLFDTMPAFKTAGKTPEEIGRIFSIVNCVMSARLEQPLDNNARHEAFQRLLLQDHQTQLTREESDRLELLERALGASGAQELTVEKIPAQENAVAEGTSVVDGNEPVQQVSTEMERIVGVAPPPTDSKESDSGEKNSFTKSTQSQDRNDQRRTQEDRSRVPVIIVDLTVASEQPVYPTYTIDVDPSWDKLRKAILDAWKNVDDDRKTKIQTWLTSTNDEAKEQFNTAETGVEKTLAKEKLGLTGSGYLLIALLEGTQDAKHNMRFVHARVGLQVFTETVETIQKSVPSQKSDTSGLDDL